MPALGADMDEGTLEEWLVKPGDTVSRGQVVAVVETTKAAVEVECWHDGTVHELLVPVGQTVSVGPRWPPSSSPAKRPGRPSLNPSPNPPRRRPPNRWPRPAVTGGGCPRPHDGSPPRCTSISTPSPVRGPRER